MINSPSKLGMARAATVVVAATLLLAGCTTPGAGSSSNTSSSVKPTSTASTDMATFTSDAKALVAKVTAPQTSTPPSTGPKAIKDKKKIFVIACSMAAEGCSRPANAIVAAAKAIGWDATINDPGGDPSKMANAVAQAVSSGYNAIALTAIDAQTIKAPLEAAKAAGLKIVANASVDLASGNPIFNNSVASESDYFAQGYAMGAKMFVDQGPDMKVAILSGTEFGTVRLRLDGTKQFIADCVAAGGGCSIADEQNFLVTDLTTSLPGQAAAMVRAQPNATALWIGYDAGANFAIQGLEAAGASLPVYSFDGNVANLTRIAQGKMEAASAASAMQWIGYGLIDNLNRIWSNQPVVDQGVSFKLMTKDNVGTGKAWNGDKDVSADYKKIWGVN